MGTKRYEIYIPDDFSNTEAAFRDLIKQHSHYFEGYVMADYRGDPRYSYQSDSFEVTEVWYGKGDNAGSFEFEVDVQYFEGCKDRNYLDQEVRTAEFSLDKSKKCLVFELDETIWNPDN
ncbi:hypothetical protein PGO52_13435 [Klebsiella aerogenes]